MRDRSKWRGFYGMWINPAVIKFYLHYFAYCWRRTSRRCDIKFHLRPVWMEDPYIKNISFSSTHSKFMWFIKIESFGSVKLFNIFILVVELEECDFFFFARAHEKYYAEIRYDSERKESWNRLRHADSFWLCRARRVFPAPVYLALISCSPKCFTQIFPLTKVTWNNYRVCTCVRINDCIMIHSPLWPLPDVRGWVIYGYYPLSFKRYVQ